MFSLPPLPRTNQTPKVKTCENEYKEGGVGLDCLTIQSELFGMRAKLSNLKLQEALLDFIGNLGTGYGF
jgi:hypothetical protein